MVTNIFYNFCVISKPPTCTTEVRTLVSEGSFKIYVRLGRVFPPFSNLSLVFNGGTGVLGIYREIVSQGASSGI